MDERDRRQSSPRREDDDVLVRLTRLEDLVSRIADDIKAARVTAVDGLEQATKRITYLEEVRVRALEDWRLSQSVLDRERSQVKKHDEQTGISRREFRLGLATIVTALICSGLLNHINF
jgi:hypothetical protein